jgi:alpha-L-fucosidase
MKKYFLLLIVFAAFVNFNAQDFTHEIKQQRDERTEWWRDARFGMFIHWGLYSIPAGEWNGVKTYAEWIRTQAQIPVEEYDKFVGQFNPVKFNAEDWVKMAKYAGMKYIVITSKHHDGFCLFDSKYTDFDIMSTPFKRDVLKELSEACKKEGMKLCFYHSIMDWHHPDYLPRRDWEKTRSTEGADFEKYVAHLKNQLKELETNYGNLGVLWFDGEWENTWSDERGRDLYNYVRSLQPQIIVNNRVSSARGGMEGFTVEGGFAGDFGTPEQTIPATGLPGIDWESCMTMNDYWGYNKNDKNWKSAKEILQMLADIASKGGNYLLNVGPTSEGVFPNEAIERLAKIGEWMNKNGEAIYGTSASPFRKLYWGRCTQKKTADGTRLYLHVFDWPADGKLIVSGIYNEPETAFVLADEKRTPLAVERKEDALIISIPAQAPNANNSVIILDVLGKADVNNPPTIKADGNIFIDTHEVTVKSEQENIEIYYTLDGSVPTLSSQKSDGKIVLTNSAVLSVRCFRDGKPISGTATETFTKVVPEASVKIENVEPGISYKYFEGNWERLPDFSSMKVLKEGTIPSFVLVPEKAADYYGVEYTGFINIPVDGVYTFYTASDDGSRLFIGDKLIVDNDTQHGTIEKSGSIALAKGLHPIRVAFFESSGGDELEVLYRGAGILKKEIPADVLFHSK